MRNKFVQWLVRLAVVACLTVPLGEVYGKTYSGSKSSRSRITVRSSPSEVRSSGGKTGFVKPKTYSGSSGKTYSGSTKKTYSGGSTGKTYSGGSNSTIRNRKPSPPKLQIIKAENIKKYRNSDYYRKAHPAAAPRSSYTTSSGRVIVARWQGDAGIPLCRNG